MAWSRSLVTVSFPPAVAVTGSVVSGEGGFLWQPGSPNAMKSMCQLGFTIWSIVHLLSKCIISLFWLGVNVTVGCSVEGRGLMTGRRDARRGSSELSLAMHRNSLRTNGCLADDHFQGSPHWRMTHRASRLQLGKTYCCPRLRRTALLHPVVTCRVVSAHLPRRGGNRHAFRLELKEFCLCLGSISSAHPRSGGAKINDSSPGSCSGYIQSSA